MAGDSRRETATTLSTGVRVRAHGERVGRRSADAGQTWQAENGRSTEHRTRVVEDAAGHLDGVRHAAEERVGPVGRA